MAALIPAQFCKCKNLPLFLIVACHSVSAFAEPYAEGAARAHAPERYEATFFAPFMPQNALDVILLVPGFSFDAGDESRRGLGEAGGNVLIDGERPAAKNGGLAAAIAAISAKQVAHIEIFRGGSRAGQSQGYDVVANIVRVRAHRSVTAEAQIARIKSGLIGSAALAITRDFGPFSLTSRTAFEGPGERSHGRRTIMPASGSSERIDKLRYRANYPEWSERFTITGPLSSGQFSLNAMVAIASMKEGFTFTGNGRVEAFPKHRRRLRGEAGLDWSLPLGKDYQLKLLSLARQTDLDGWEIGQVGRDENALQMTDRFDSDTRTSEAILSANLNRTGSARWRPEFRIEASRNTLHKTSVFSRFEDADVPPEVVSDTAGVRESRVEAGAGLNWFPTGPWSVAAGAAYEISWIRGLGSAVGENRFAFLKPRLLFSWKPNARNDVRLSLRRTVGQLSFEHFAASANLAEGISAGGNARLGPDHRVSSSVEFDRRFGKRGALRLRAWHDWRRDVLELAVLSSGRFGVANISKARMWGASASLDLSTDGIVPGGLLKLHYSRFGSRVSDPVTGDRRIVNGGRVSDMGGSFRMNLAESGISLGAEATRGYTVGYWYADEQRVQKHLWETSVFVETNRFLETRFRLEARGLVASGNSFHRLLYAPNRTAVLVGQEIWNIRTPMTVTLSASKIF